MFFVPRTLLNSLGHRRLPNPEAHMTVSEQRPITSWRALYSILTSVRVLVDRVVSN